MAERAAAMGTATDSEQFRALAAAELPKLYAVARRLVGDEAEDAVQDCLLKGFRGYRSITDPSAGPAWLLAILVNCCRDRGRSHVRRPDQVELEEAERFSLFRTIADEDPFPYSDSLHLDFLQQFGREDLHAVLLSLPEMYRAPLALVHMEGFSTKEVAEMLGAPRGTILARLHRGRKLLEKRLWDYATTHGLLKEGPR
ncbi:MAG TPA: RNA polymerase sigma factor [Acidimicrobiales bacterium]|nr:RNA polymerase sigma factor [Acidimicrobiales bacterium]